MAEFLVALAEFDEKRLWEELGYRRLFYFLRRELGLSSGAAFYRKTAAQLIRRFPEIVEPLGTVSRLLPPPAARRRGRLPARGDA